MKGVDWKMVAVTAGAVVGVIAAFWWGLRALDPKRMRR